MADRVSSDHSSVATVRATLTRSGATSRPLVSLPEDSDADFPADEVVRVVVDGQEYHALVERPLTGDGFELRGAYDTPEMARTKQGENRLREWTERANVSFGGSVLVDEVEPGFQYGIREPGTRVVYEAKSKPNSSLADIAKDLDE